MGKATTIIIILVLIAVAVTAYYLISPAFKTLDLDEDSPLTIKDSMLSMTDEQKKEFNDAVDAMQDQKNEMSDNMPSQAQLLSQGNFKPRAHEVEGEALLIQDGDQKILRFENFETINGPNLHIYLASDLSDDDFIDLGEIKATSGNVNYNIPQNTDTDKYNKVLVWCVPFKVLFSYAEV